MANFNSLRTEFYESKVTKKRSVFVALPAIAWQPIEGACGCAFCKAHPELIPQWDTMVVSADKDGARHSHVCHYPEFTNPLARSFMTVYQSEQQQEAMARAFRRQCKEVQS